MRKIHDSSIDELSEDYGLVLDNFLEKRGGPKYKKTVRKPKEKRPRSVEPANDNISLKYEMKDVKPKTSNQRRVFESYNYGNNLVLSGTAGTGKTFLSLYLGLRELLLNEIDKIYIVRSATPVKNVGFLPGKLSEKLEAYEDPYKMLFLELFANKSVYETLKRTGKLEFISTSYLRGTTFNNAFVIVDECQSMTEHELDTVLTRLGGIFENSIVR